MEISKFDSKSNDAKVWMFSFEKAHESNGWIDHLKANLDCTIMQYSYR